MKGVVDVDMVLLFVSGIIFGLSSLFGILFDKIKPTPKDHKDYASSQLCLKVCKKTLLLSTICFLIGTIGMSSRTSSSHSSSSHSSSSYSSSSYSSSSETKKLKCQSCGREFSQGTSDYKSIKKTNMCSNCYKNYQYAINTRGGKHIEIIHDHISEEYSAYVSQ